MQDAPELSRARRVAFWTVLATLTAAVVAGGAWLARIRLARGPAVAEVRLPAGAAGTVRDLIESYQRNETLGGMIAPGERRGAARAYLDPPGALASLDEIVFGVPNVPTPFVGAGPRPGASHNARVNALQFRDDRELSAEKEPGVRRVFLTGGSVAFGSAAPSQDRTVGAYLQRMLDEGSPAERRTEVFTLANPAWASTQERILIENRLSELDPDLVVSLSGTNDVHWGVFGHDVLWFRTYTDELFRSLVDVGYRSAGLAPLPNVVPPAGDPVEPAVVAERLEKNVRIAAFALSLEGVPYVFALQPNLHATGKELSARERELVSPLRDYGRRCYDEIRRRLSAVDADNFRFVDLSGVFDSLGPDQEIFIDSYHFGDRGNEVLARALAGALRGERGT